jgi:pilus assembly protein CpaB
MPAKTLLAVLFLISLGTAAVVCFRALPLNAEAPTPNDEILVTTTPLPAGTLLRTKDVTWQSRVGKPEPGAFLRPLGSASNATAALDQQARGEVYGAALRVDVAAGDPVRRTALVKPGDRDFLQVVLTPGSRAIAIPVVTGGASTGLLYPGDRVDVILTQTFKNDTPLAHRSVSETVVENLRVLVIDATDAKSGNTGTNFGRTVTLEVTPEQAEKINVATELGKLSLTLRSFNVSSDGASTLPGFAKTVNVTPTWAGDVSPALGDAAPPIKATAVERPTVEVIHGTKSVAVKTQ